MPKRKRRKDDKLDNICFNGRWPIEREVIRSARRHRMIRNGLILLQAVGALSILVYPAVLVANIMSIAAEGHTFKTSLPWVLLSFYPLVWIVLDVFAWRAMSRGAIALAFGLSSIPALACLLVAGIYVFS